jgi:hypothetical protein
VSVNILFRTPPVKLDDYLKHPVAPDARRETPWLSFCTLDLASGRLLIGDVQFLPSLEDCSLVELPVGRYRIEVKFIELDGQRHVSRLRLTQACSHAKRGRWLGTTWTDTAQTGVCDYDSFRKAWVDFETSYELIRGTIEGAVTHGIAVLDTELGAVMPFVASGLGDGEYPVYELVAGSARVGVEIRFTTLKKASKELSEFMSGRYGTEPIAQIDLGTSALVDDVANSVTTGCFAPSEPIDVLASDHNVGTFVIGCGPLSKDSGEMDDESH